MTDRKDRAQTSSTEALASDLAEAAELASVPGQVEAFLASVLDVLSEALPSELATFLELRRNVLALRSAKGPLAETARRARIPLETNPRLDAVLRNRELVVVERDTEGFEELLSLGASRSCLVVPITVGDEPRGLLTFHNRRAGRFDADALGIASIYGHLIGLGVVAARRAEELETYQQHLQEQNRLLIEEVAADTDACRALQNATSRPMRRLVQMAKQVALSEAPVLITGETGAGKEVTARAIHGWSRRSDASFVQVNCAALPENLIESELFGHRRGAFSGAHEDRLGRFRVADGGTLFLDEVGDLPLGTQVKLLRVLQEGAFEPVGSDRTVEVNVRILAATNVDLERALDEGSFREDLFYRLNVFPIRVPALRERPEDIPALTTLILERRRRQTGRGPWTVTETALRNMKRYGWPGNVRELVNTLERARVLSPLGGRLKIELGVGPRGKAKRPGTAGRWPSLKQYEREYLERVLEKTRGKIYGDDGAAALLDVPPTTLQSKLRRLGIKKSKGKP